MHFQHLQWGDPLCTTTCSLPLSFKNYRPQMIFSSQSQTVSGQDPVLREFYVIQDGVRCVHTAGLITDI